MLYCRTRGKYLFNEMIYQKCCTLLNIPLNVKEFKTNSSKRIYADDFGHMKYFVDDATVGASNVDLIDFTLRLCPASPNGTNGHNYNSL